jgi:hypothetical protein
MDLGCADHNLPGGVAGSTVFGGFCAHIGLVTRFYRRQGGLPKVAQGAQSPMWLPPECPGAARTRGGRPGGRDVKSDGLQDLGRRKATSPQSRDYRSQLKITWRYRRAC